MLLVVAGSGVLKRSKCSWHLNILILFSRKLLSMTVSSFILFAYVITTSVLNILKKALKNMYPVLESYLFSVIYPKLQIVSSTLTRFLVVRYIVQLQMTMYLHNRYRRLNPFLKNVNTLSSLHSLHKWKCNWNLIFFNKS